MATDVQIQQVVQAISVCSHFEDQTPFSAVANALAEYEKNKWIPIENPPTEWSSVILKFDPADLEEIGFSNCAYTAIYQPKDGSFYDCDPLDEWQIKPTHWQALPSV
jgi:hypothetical protein